MKLWLLSQDKVDGYDTYDSLVVAAETAEEARKIHPSSRFAFYKGRDVDHWANDYSGWAVKPEDVVVELIGEAWPDSRPAGVICASFNAG